MPPDRSDNHPQHPFGQHGAVSAEARSIAERARLQQQLSAPRPPPAR